jgi:hypothetical protein
VLQMTPKARMLTNTIEDKIRITHKFNLYEDDLYFVSQMFEENWTPRDTIIDYTDETISGEPLKWTA